MRLILITFFIFLLGILNCGNDMAHISIEIKNALNNYKNWQKPVNQILSYGIPGHDARARIIYANDIAYNTSKIINERKIEKVILSEGSIIIKELYMKSEEIDKKIPMLTIMVKDSKHPNAIDNWLYFIKKPGENIVLISGRLCSGCHEAANEDHPYFDRNEEKAFRDYVFVPLIKKKAL